MTGDESFHDPPWDAPLDDAEVIASLPEGATIKGMFLDAMVARAAASGVTLPSARPPYLPFRSYPLREHCTVLVEMARGVWPDEPLRQSLRRVGRGGATAIVGSTLGRVTVGAAVDPEQVVRQMAQTFTLVCRPGTITVVDAGPGRAVLELRELHFFADSHHVGVYEGALRFARVADARVRVRQHDRSNVDLLCTWAAG